MNRTVILFPAIGLTTCVLLILRRDSLPVPTVVEPTIQVATSQYAAGLISRENTSVAPVVASNPVSVTAGSIPNASYTEAGDKNVVPQISRYHPWEISALASTNREAALAAAMSLPGADDRCQALAAVCFGVAKDDPAEAVKLAETLPLSQQAGATLENLVQQWASADFASALVWANQQQPGQQRDALMTRVAYVMSQADSMDAANLVLNQIPAGPDQDEAIMTVLHQWAGQDLAGAANWVKTFQDSQIGERALQDLEGFAAY